MSLGLWRSVVGNPELALCVCGQEKRERGAGVVWSDQFENNTPQRPRTCCAGTLGRQAEVSIRLRWGPTWEGCPGEVTEAGAEVGERLPLPPRICQPSSPASTPGWLGDATGLCVCVTAVSGSF